MYFLLVEKSPFSCESSACAGAGHGALTSEGVSHPKQCEILSDSFLGRLQVGEARGSSGQVLLRGPQHQDHHVAAPHGRVRQELRAVAVAAQPAARGHAAVQPEVPVPGESWVGQGHGLTWLVSPGWCHQLPRSHGVWEGACWAVWGLCQLRAWVGAHKLVSCLQRLWGSDLLFINQLAWP